MLTFIRCRWYTMPALSINCSGDDNKQVERFYEITLGVDVCRGGTVSDVFCINQTEFDRMDAIMKEVTWSNCDVLLTLEGCDGYLYSGYLFSYTNQCEGVCN
jgi:hypothetical protein